MINLQEISFSSLFYIDKHLVENQTIPGMGMPEVPSALEFTERMTNLLKSPSSLDSQARTENLKNHS